QGGRRIEPAAEQNDGFHCWARELNMGNFDEVCPSPDSICVASSPRPTIMVLILRAVCRVWGARMLRFRLCVLYSAAISALCAKPAFAQKRVDAQWVWLDDENPAESAPAGKVWFRREYLADEPSTGAAIMACDDEFILWVNGQKVGAGGGMKSYLFNLNGIV